MNNEIQHPKKRAFLAAFSECGNITQAAELADIDRTSHYRWVKEDPVYAAAFADAEEAAADRLEQEARRRAVEGVEEPVFHKGKVVGTVRKYSDTLLIFLLNGAKPEKYKQRTQTEHTGKISHDVYVEGMNDDELRSGIEATLQAIADLQARIGTTPKT